MKKFYSTFITMLLAGIMSAQCTAELSLIQDGNLVIATLTGSGAVTENYTINWGDGQFDFAASGSHTYVNDGTYEVCGVYFDEDNAFTCYVQDCETVVVGTGSGPCEMTFEPFATGFTVGFTIDGTGAANPGYSVDWGDGTAPSTGSDAVFHTYTETGTYTICVTYYDMDNEENCTVEVCQEVEIEGSKSACTVEITVTMDGNTVTVTSVGSGAEQPTYGIGWGDGSFPTLNSTGAHTYTVSGTYNICVTYIDLANAQTCSATDCEEVTIVGVEEIAMTLGSVKVMPNPVNDDAILEISLTGSAYVTADVMDITGKRIMTVVNGNRGQGAHRIEWSAADLSSGVYFIRLRANDETQTVRVVKK